MFVALTGALFCGALRKQLKPQADAVDAELPALWPC